MAYTGKLIVLGNDDTITVVPNDGHESLSNAVKGYIELIAYNTPLKLKSKTVMIDIYCNEEFMLKDDDAFDKINVFASYFYTGYIYSNIVVEIHLPDDEIDFEDDACGDARGFTDEEAEEAVEIFKKMIVETAYKEIHEVYDGKKKDIIAPPVLDDSPIKCTKYRGIKY